MRQDRPPGEIIGHYEVEVLVRIPGEDNTHSIGVVRAPITFDAFGPGLAIHLSDTADKLRKALG